MEPNTWDMYMSTMRNETVARYLDPELHELVSHLRSELSEQNSEMRALQAENEQLQAEVDLMRKMDEPTLVALQQNNAEIERLHDQVVRLSTLIDAERGLRDAEIERLRSEINQEVVARRGVEDKLEDACVEIEQLRGLLLDVDDGLDNYWITTKEGVAWICRRSEALG